MRRSRSLITLSCACLILAGCSDWFHVAEQRPVALVPKDVTSRAGPAPAQPIDPVGADWTVLHDANLRTGPSMHDPILGTIAAGETLRVEGRVRGGHWLRVETRGGTTAYVHASLVGRHRVTRARAAPREPAAAAVEPVVEPAAGAPETAPPAAAPEPAPPSLGALGGAAPPSPALGALGGTVP